MRKIKLVETLKMLFKIWKRKISIRKKDKETDKLENKEKEREEEKLHDEKETPLQLQHEADHYERPLPSPFQQQSLINPNKFNENPQEQKMDIFQTRAPIQVHEMSSFAYQPQSRQPQMMTPFPSQMHQFFRENQRDSQFESKILGAIDDLKKNFSKEILSL